MPPKKAPKEKKEKKAEKVVELDTDSEDGMKMDDGIMSDIEKKILIGGAEDDEPEEVEEVEEVEGDGEQDDEGDDEGDGEEDAEEEGDESAGEEEEEEVEKSEGKEKVEKEDVGGDGDDEGDGDDCLYDLLAVDDDDVYEEVQVEKRIVPTNERITKPFLSNYERTRLKADRARQLSLGAKPMIKDAHSLTDRKKAEMEIRLKVIPLKIHRELPNGLIEEWKITEFLNI